MALAERQQGFLPEIRLHGIDSGRGSNRTRCPVLDRGSLWSGSTFARRCEAAGKRDSNDQAARSQTKQVGKAVSGRECVLSAGRLGGNMSVDNPLWNLVAIV